MSDRRSFLRGLATISVPLIGGGVTLIGKSAPPVPLIKAVAMPTLQTPHERARYAWEAFSGAMREISAGSHGWYVRGGECQPFRHLAGHSWVQPELVHYDVDVDPRCPGLVVDRHEEFSI